MAGRHLTQDELIQVRFDLAEGPEGLLMREHLDECDQCREAMARLAGKLSALDEIKAEAEVSEELAAKAISGATEKEISNLKSEISKRQRDFGMPVWMQGVAAVLVAGLLSYGAYVMVNGAGGRDGRTGQISNSRSQNDSAKGKMGLAEVTSDESRVTSREPGTLAMAPASIADAEKPMERLEEEKAPFAPASAIELNVLPRRENVQLTIYNSADLTLVRESRKLTLKKGWNWLQFMWANTLIDPTSLSMEPLAEKDKIGIQQLVYPARLKDVGRWLIHSDIEGQVPFEITYFTSGVRWRAFYMGTLSADESQMRLEGFVRVDNGSGEEYQDALTRLVVGQVHQLEQIAMLAKRQYPYGSPAEPLRIGGDYYFADKDVRGRKMFDYSLAETLDRAANKPKEVAKEALSEYFLYTIEGTETIPEGWGKRLPSFAADGVKVESLYKYDQERWGASTIRYVSFVNDEQHKLGQTPLPDGMVRVYGQAADGKGLSYVGATGVKYIPVGEKVEMNLGVTTEVVVEPKLMSFATTNIQYGGQGNVRGWDEVRTWQIEVRNTRRTPARVEITRGFESDYWQLETEPASGYEKYDGRHARFTLNLEAGQKKIITYTVTTNHGNRKQGENEED